MFAADVIVVLLPFCHKMLKQLIVKLFVVRRIHKIKFLHCTTGLNLQHVEYNVSGLQTTQRLSKRVENIVLSHVYQTYRQKRDKEKYILKHARAFPFLDTLSLTCLPRALPGCLKARKKQPNILYIYIPSTARLLCLCGVSISAMVSQYIAVSQ